MSNFVTSTLTLLGGASLGAATLFLLDPDKGSARRDQIASGAQQAVGSAHEAIHSTLSHAGQYAHQAAAHVRDRVGHTADDLSQHAQGIADHARKAAEDAIHSAMGTVRGYAGRAADQANEYSSQATRQARAAHDKAVDRASSLLSRVRSSAREQVAPSHPYATASGITIGTVGLLAAGAGAMYLFDPTRGVTRRARLRDKMFSVTRRTGKSARQYGRHLGNQMKGAAHDAGKTAQQWADSASDAVHEHMRTSSSSPLE
jgi:gas vesicle protein